MASRVSMVVFPLLKVLLLLLPARVLAVGSANNSTTNGRASKSRCEQVASTTESCRNSAYMCMLSKAPIVQRIGLHQ
jgi:hypothetical protein